MTRYYLTHPKEYGAWIRMKTLCYNEKVPGYSVHGKKGITVCQEWVDDFAKFLQDMGKIPENCKGLKRIDPAKNFTKENCIWYEKAKSKKTRKKKSLKEPIHVSIVLERAHLEHIQKQALKISSEQGKILHPRELIRNALQIFFPYQENGNAQ